VARRVVSLIRAHPGAVRSIEPSLEANAYAVASEVDLAVVLRGAGIELAVAGSEVCPGELGGRTLPPAASADDLRGLLESGIAVYVAAEDLAQLGLSPHDLIDGVQPADAQEIADLLRAADAVLCW
jgi:sulfur relay (sulfurtransferase) DsrF/TusC family protein